MTGTYTDSLDVDTYRVDLGSGQHLRSFTTWASAGPSFYTELELVDDSDTVIVSSVFDSEAGFSYLEHTNDTPDTITLYLRTNLFFGGGSFPYSLVLLTD